MSEVFALTESFDRIESRLVNTVAISSEGETMDCCKAQWDTGASCSCISQEVVDRLCLVPISEAMVRTPSGERMMDKYLIDVALTNTISVHDVLVLGAEIGNQGLDILIGMDIINQGDFAVSNYEGITQFTFRVPSAEHADYRNGNTT